ncbi:hypothetical protein GUITHDRAFT_108161 [Guillardia theta CCMP2712]|uniref:Sulfotransferase domain-containing protein n=2 Tax=Guillardia theta (strain CCMP2712) TaxID=905079 RepID=L1JCT1_GUITC|nr:hypothetical protein GUITHDRAFT_108161 [Guillardia theta CCMP2712]EKX46127.1 hypothetical protein GUITHDRAFT_108161 [Guillardia theta CCMP2712]|eukprot:XP_005833107.1 hypothetical protein GUITHDRAFT_108161 [Guillardia theta CCMP2712]
MTRHRHPTDALAQSLCNSDDNLVGLRASTSIDDNGNLFVDALGLQEQVNYWMTVELFHHGKDNLTSSAYSLSAFLHDSCSPARNEFLSKFTRHYDITRVGPCPPAPQTRFFLEQRLVYWNNNDNKLIIDMRDISSLFDYFISVVFRDHANQVALSLSQEQTWTEDLSYMRFEIQFELKHVGDYQVESFLTVICKHDRSVIYEVSNTTAWLTVLEMPPGQRLPQVYLLSVPKSGNTWLRYILENITESPSVGDRPVLAASGIKDPYKYPAFLVKKHRIDLSQVVAGEKVILIIRNPIESVLRHIRHFSYNAMGLSEVIENIIINWKAYQDFPGPKLLIKYEELIEKSSSSCQNLLGRIFDFIDNGDYSTRIQQFCDELGIHKEKSRRHYTKVLGLIIHNISDGLHHERVLREKDPALLQVALEEVEEQPILKEIYTLHYLQK